MKLTSVPDCSRHVAQFASIDCLTAQLHGLAGWLLGGGWLPAAWMPGCSLPPPGPSDSLSACVRATTGPRSAAPRLLDAVKMAPTALVTGASRGELAARVAAATWCGCGCRCCCRPAVRSARFTASPASLGCGLPVPQ
jgi:hypothetical protein